jgi:hypothetical protein
MNYNANENMTNVSPVTVMAFCLHIQTMVANSDYLTSAHLVDNLRAYYKLFTGFAVEGAQTSDYQASVDTMLGELAPIFEQYLDSERASKMVPITAPQVTKAGVTSTLEFPTTSVSLTEMLSLATHAAANPSQWLVRERLWFQEFTEFMEAYVSARKRWNDFSKASAAALRGKSTAEVVEIFLGSAGPELLQLAGDPDSV